jgi:malonyl-CoA O-methyltransferase
MNERKAEIAAHFSRAAEHYDQHADAQRAAADRLLALLDEQLAGKPPSSALEFGCGTGYLSRGLLARWPSCNWLISDISADMLAHCEGELRAEQLVGKTTRFALIDAENPQIDTEFALITSSLAFQWFEQPAAALARLYSLLAPGGRLQIATLGSGSFAEWRASHTALDLPCGAANYPDAATLLAMAPNAGKAQLRESSLQIGYRSGRDFLHALKGIGADLPTTGYRGLSAAQMRRVLRHFDAEFSGRISYHLLYLIVEKPA